MYSPTFPAAPKVAGLLAIAALSACTSETGLYSEYIDFPLSQPGQLEDPTVTDRVVQVTTPEVDVLFVVDNSCSMSDNQAKLGEEFPTFLDFFLGSGLDYHIGVTSTDADSSYGNPLEGRLVNVGGVRYIDPTLGEEQASQIFTSMVSLGTSGSGVEKGLAAAFMALELRRDKQNAGFYRDDAALHTVAVSDEQDQSDDMRPELITLNEFIDWYDGLKDVIEDRTFSSIVCSSAAGLAGGCIQPDVGTRYMTVTREIGGIVWDINDDNFAEVLEQLGVQASGFKREYFLTQAPIPETLDVRIERVVQGQATVSPKRQGTEKDGGDYYYNESRNSIVFYSFVPDPLDEVVISYTLLSAAQDPNYDVNLTDEVASDPTE
jgi:hypothetical protein